MIEAQTIHYDKSISSALPLPSTAGDVDVVGNGSAVRHVGHVLCSSNHGTTHAA
jgi:hypothetical protein